MTATALLATAILFTAVSASSAETAQGTLDVNGKTYAIRHAYAVADQPELAMPGGGKDGYDLILTDTPLTDAELECRTLLQYRARKGEVHGLILSIDPGKKAPHNGHLLHDKSAIFFSILPNSDQHKVEVKTISRDTVSGRFFMPKPHETDIPGVPLKMQYDVSVDAQVRRPGPVTATLIGPRAAASPQAKALAAFVKAARAGNVAALKQVAVKEQMALLEGEEGKQFLQMMKQAMPDPAKIKVTKVTVRGNAAVVHGRAPEPAGDMALKCYLIGGQWRPSIN